MSFAWMKLQYLMNFLTLVSIQLYQKFDIKAQIHLLEKEKKCKIHFLYIWGYFF